MTGNQNRKAKAVMKKLDEFVNDLQEQIFEEAKAAYGEKGFDRWRNPRYQGRMTDPDGQSCVTGPCGDTMEIYLKFEEEHVKAASYFTDGCASSAICASFAAELALDKDPDDLADISGDTVREEIGHLPQEDTHCADLAAAAVQEALSDYMQKQRYRKEKKC
jgi:nitrogen fixation NifU-like protein